MTRQPGKYNKTAMAVSGLAGTITTALLDRPIEWPVIVPAIVGAILVYLVPNTKGIIMTENDPYASARLMGVGGVPPLPEKPPEDSPEVTALKAELARLKGESPLPPVSSSAAPGLSQREVAGPSPSSPATSQAAPQPTPLSGRIRGIVSDLAEIVMELEADGVKF